MDARGDLYCPRADPVRAAHRPAAVPVTGPARTSSAWSPTGRRPAAARANPAVTPAVEAIVRKCLEPDPADRYQDAHDLQETSRRQLPPAAAAHGRAVLGERAQVGPPAPAADVRRVPREVARVLLLFATASVAVLISGTPARARAARDARRIPNGQPAVPALFHRPARGRVPVAGRGGLERPSGPLALPGPGRPGVELGPGHSPSTAGGPATAPRRGRRHPADARPRDGERDRRPADVGRRRLGSTSRPPGASPRGIPAAFFTQQAELPEHLGGGPGRPRPSAGWRASRASGRDYIWPAGSTPGAAGSPSRSRPWKEAATQILQCCGPGFLLGRSYDGLGRDADAVAAYGACLALQPDAHQVWFQRGFRLAPRRLPERPGRLRPCRGAETGLGGRVLQPAPAKKELHDYAGAEADLTKALEARPGVHPIDFVRAEVRAKLGDKAGAERDRREGFAGEPADESSWTARGFARLSSDPKGARPTSTDARN